MNNVENFHLHLIFYISAILIGALISSAAKVSGLPHWGFIFGFGIFLIVMAVLGILIAIKDILNDKPF